MKKFILAGTLLVGFVVSAHAASLDLSNPRAYQFRTRLRDAWKEPANFAGHYVLATWGCGTECMEGAAIDKRTGRVVFLLDLSAYVPDAAAAEPNFDINSSVIQWKAYRYQNVEHKEPKDFYVVFDGKNFHRQ